MPLRSLSAPQAPAAKGGYAQAMEVTEATRWLFISGQIPEDAHGHCPADFDGQCRQAWLNLLAQLSTAGLDATDLVKVTIFLARREDALANRAIRQEMLRGHAPAMTVILPAIFDAAWLIEIEAVAAR